MKETPSVAGRTTSHFGEEYTFSRGYDCTVCIHAFVLSLRQNNNVPVWPGTWLFFTCFFPSDENELSISCNTNREKEKYLRACS